jgi:hypothetical protein
VKASLGTIRADGPGGRLCLANDPGCHRTSVTANALH